MAVDWGFVVCIRVHALLECAWCVRLCYGSTGGNRDMEM